MLDSLLLSGDESAVADSIRAIFDWGADEVLASVITIGNADESRLRTLRLLAEVDK